MAGKSNTSEMASLRVPLDVMAAAREAATADGQSWASWVVDSLRARLPGAAGEEVVSVRLDPELVASTKERAAADGIAWPEWLDRTLRSALVVKLPDTIAVIRGAEVRHEDPPRKRAKPIRLVADTPAPPRDRWTDGARCRQCGAMMRAGKCALGCK